MKIIIKKPYKKKKKTMRKFKLSPFEYWIITLEDGKLQVIESGKRKDWFI